MLYIFSLPQNINRNQKISAMNGKEFFLVDVIAHILHHLKCRLLTVLKDFGYKDLKASDIDWVITVPAIWRSRGRKMMYEAGYMVSSNSNCKCLISSIRCRSYYFFCCSFFVRLVPSLWISTTAEKGMCK